jgi:hypothetical protein
MSMERKSDEEAKKKQKIGNDRKEGFLCRSKRSFKSFVVFMDPPSPYSFLFIDHTFFYTTL